MDDDTPNIWALLVGINAYLSPSVPNLRGCCNDVEAMRRFLLTQMHVPDRHIKVLVDQEATRTGILDAFKNFLIDNQNIPHGSQLLIHYSGHGSQMRNMTGTEPDGIDETIVPYDSRVGGVFDIPDKTLAGLIRQLATAKGDNITVILDCCHSGSGTREFRPEGAAPTRRAPADVRLPPVDLDADFRVSATTRGIGRSGWSVTRANHVLLAGCLDREESHEHDTPEGVCHGALTYFALEYLRQKPPNAAYADLHARVKAQVSGLYPRQTPQCEGQHNRAIFGGADVERDPFIPIKGLHGSTVTFEAGLVHGLRRGTELAVYAANVRTKRSLPTPLAVAQVQSVTATTAQATFIAAPTEPLPSDAHALVTRQAYAAMRQKVALMPGEGAQQEKALNALRQAILDAGGEATPSAFLELLDDPHQPTDLRVTADDGQLSVRDDMGHLLVLPQDFTQGGAVAVRQALESIARYRTILALANQQPSSLMGRITLRIRRCLGGGDCTAAEDLAPGEVDPDGMVTLDYHPDLPDRNFYVVDVMNDSSLDVYPHLFVLNPDYSIYRLYPALGQNEALLPGTMLSSGLPNAGGSVLQVSLPGDAPGEERWDISHERLKLIVTTAPSDLALLEQAPLRVPARRRDARAGASPFEQLLEAVTSGIATRGRPYTPAFSDDWGTAELPYTVVRASDARTLSAPQSSIPLGDGITLEKPQGFEGKISVAPLEQTRHSISGETSLKLPPGLAQLSDVFEPIARSGTRGLSGQPLVITLDIDDASRALIRPDNPLRLRLPDELSADDLLPIVFDGEDYLPVGYAGDDGAVDVVRIPQPAAGVGAQGVPSRRGLGRAIQLFIYKKMGRHARHMGLRYVEHHNGAVEYSPVTQDRFKPGDRIAVFVHGFLSDTRWMARDVAPFLRAQVLPYEHALTWDYETFGTRVELNGADFATALRQQCGCGANDDLTMHVYAHGMGSLVSRCLVELAGGHEFVDCLVLAGPPNRGTTLATLSRGFTYLLSALINNVGAIPLAGAVDWLLKELYEQGQGWQDLAVDSDLTKRLNALDAPSDKPYLVLAGVNTLNQTQGRRLNRLAQKMLDRTLDAIFGEPENDAVIGMSSLKGVRNGAYPALTVKTLPCDHFSYFATAEGQLAIREWMLS
jgi:hypothetical protein